MTRTKGPMRWAGVFVGLSALLHIVALFVSGFHPDGIQLAIIGVIYAGFAYGLMQGWRWLAYIVFIVMFLGTSVAMQGIWAAGAVPGWVFTGIVVANLSAVIMLFAALWRSAEAVAP